MRPLVICAKHNLLLYEQRALTAYKDNLYNIALTAGSQKGFVHDEVSRAKIKAARAKQVFSSETRALWSRNRTGKKMPEWFPDFMRKVKTGTKLTLEARAKISAAQIGKKLSDVTKQRKSEAMKQYWATRKLRLQEGVSK
jgi:hypothetical protein